jgi:hypothetical protein
MVRNRVVKKSRFSLARMCHGEKRQIPPVCNMLWYKTSDLAWPDCVVVQNIRFSMARMGRGKKPYNLAWLECVVVKTVIFSMDWLERVEVKNVRSSMAGM